MALSDRKVLRETDNFRLEVGNLQVIGPKYRPAIGYLLINKRTNVVEKEGFSEAEAIRVLYLNERYLQDVLSDPSGERTQPGPESTMLSILPDDGQVH